MRILLAAILLLCLGLPGRINAEPATGVVRGKVSVLKKKFFGGLEKADDASGVVVYVTGYTEAGPKQEAGPSRRTSASSRACCRSWRGRA